MDHRQEVEVGEYFEGEVFAEVERFGEGLEVAEFWATKTVQLRIILDFTHFRLYYVIAN